MVFAAASFTDFVDGYLARSRGSITTFGKLMDPVADKLLIVGALLALVSLNRLDAWVAMVIIAREFAVTVLRLGAQQHGMTIAAAPLGKLKTVIQVAMVMSLILWDGHAWVDALVYVTVAITLISGADVLLGIRRHARESRKGAATS